MTPRSHQFRNFEKSEDGTHINKTATIMNHDARTRMRCTRVYNLLWITLVGSLGLLPVQASYFVILSGSQSTRGHQHGTSTIGTTTARQLQEQADSSVTSSHHPLLPAPTILYESNRILAIHKPQGISHHDDGDPGSGIMSLVRSHQQSEQQGDIAYQGRIYGVHRLDRVTSGILLFAKDAETAQVLSQKFRDGEIAKYYCGISGKKPTKKKQGWVRGNMVQGRRKSWMLQRDSDEKKNFAETRFFTSGLSSLAEYSIDYVAQPPKTLILFRPHTGRTHQLRVAAKSVGLPLLGDPIYKDGSSSQQNDNDALAARTYLHACALHFELDDEDVTIWSPPPFGDSLLNSEGIQQFNDIVERLVQKHCDCDAITEKLV
jgi:tRNA pseudouridine32 synthase/23S rRNA pseudouridine746 synthase